MAVSKNDITGDALISKNSGNSAYADGWERIFKKPATVSCGDCETCSCGVKTDAPVEKSEEKPV